MSRQQSERIRGEALRLIADRDRRTVASQRHVDQQLDDRLRNISTWKSELSAELDRNKNETNMMMRTRYDINKETLSLKRYITDDLAVNFRSQLEHALKETEKPLRVTSDCIYNRENRMGIDRVKDDVESRLNLESDSIRNTANKLKDTLNSVLFIILFESSCKEIISVCQLKIIYGHFVTLFLVWSFFTFWFWWLTFKMC